MSTIQRTAVAWQAISLSVRRMHILAAKRLAKLSDSTVKTAVANNIDIAAKQLFRGNILFSDAEHIKNDFAHFFLGANTCESRSCSFERKKLGRCIVGGFCLQFFDHCKFISRQFLV